MSNIEKVPPRTSAISYENTAVISQFPNLLMNIYEKKSYYLLQFSLVVRKDNLQFKNYLVLVLIIYTYPLMLSYVTKLFLNDFARYFKICVVNTLRNRRGRQN